MSTNNTPGFIPPRDNNITDKDWLELSWNYFSLLSGQRMNMINFYIIIEVALIGALFTLIGMETRIRWMECAVSIAIFIFSVGFYLLDYRTKTMIHKCEDIISDIEQKYCPLEPVIRLPFHHIERETEKNLTRLTYSVVFRALFFIIGCFGIGCCYLLLKGII